MSAAVAQDPVSLDLARSLRSEWIKLPLPVMQDCGPAAQTLGGILALSKTSTFASTKTIARKARLPRRTVEKHIDTLEAKGWIKNCGRGVNRQGKPLRTPTLDITDRARSAAEEYGVLPWWATFDTERFAWSSRAVLSVIMARLMKLGAAAARIVADGDGTPDVWELVEDRGPDRWRFPIRHLEQTTGLDRKSIIAAKRDLSRRKIVTWNGGDGGVEYDTLMPRRDFVVTYWPRQNGGCCMRFEEGWNSG